MPVSGLPNNLEVYLNETLRGSTITSWNIRGEQDYTQVTIRFGSTAMLDTNVKYRKVPPSRIVRDKARAARYNDQVEVQQASEHIFTQTDEPVIENSLPDGIEAVATHLDQGYVLTPIDNVTTEFSYSPVVQVDGPVDTHTSKAEINTKPNKVVYSGPCASVCEKPKHTNAATCVYVCKGCSKDLSTEPDRSWNRCTDPKCHEFNLCNKCCDKGFHHDHIRHLMPFTMPDPGSHFCDSCGLKLINMNSCVFVCNHCQSYVMCKNCYHWAGMHWAHRNKVTKVKVQDFLGT